MSSAANDLSGQIEVDPELSEGWKREAGKSAPVPLSKMGDTGLKLQSGSVFEEYLTQLKGKRGVEAYQEMADSPLCRAFLRLLHLMAQKVEWKVKPAVEDNGPAQEQADWLQGCLDDLRTPFKQVVGEMLSCVQYGWSRAEILYKLRRGPDQESAALRSDFNDGKWGWRDFEPRAQDSLDQSEGWEWDELTGDLLGMHQYVPCKRWGRNKFFVPESKMITAIPEPWKRSPEGYSMFRAGYRPWFFARKLEDIEASWVERDSGGILKQELPPEVMASNAPAALQTVRRDYERKVSKFRAGAMAGLVVVAEEDHKGKTGYKTSVLQGAVGSRISPDVPIRRHEQRLLISLLADFLLLGLEKIGTQALFGGKWNIVALALGGLLDAAIVGPMNTKAIPDLMRLNGIPDELWPSIEYSEIEAPTIAEISELLSKLVGASVVVPSAELEEWALRKLGAPVQAEANSPPVAAQPGDEARDIVAPDALPVPPVAPDGGGAGPRSPGG